MCDGLQIRNQALLNGAMACITSRDIASEREEWGWKWMDWKSQALRSLKVEGQILIFDKESVAQNDFTTER